MTDTLIGFFEFIVRTEAMIRTSSKIIQDTYITPLILTLHVNYTDLYKVL